MWLLNPVLFGVPCPGDLALPLADPRFLEQGQLLAEITREAPPDQLVQLPAPVKKDRKKRKRG